MVAGVDCHIDARLSESGVVITWALFWKTSHRRDGTADASAARFTSPACAGAPGVSLPIDQPVGAHVGQFGSKLETPRTAAIHAIWLVSN